MICKSIVKVGEIPGASDVLQVTFDTAITAYWMYKYADALQFIDKEVYVEFRQEMYKGELKPFINTFSAVSVVNVLDADTGFKLFCDAEDNFANLSFNEIADGERRGGCRVFCVSQEYKTSPNAVWQELVVRDKTMHVAKVRCFDYANREAQFAGQYIVCELIRNQYGFRTEMIQVVEGECPPNPELTIATKYVENFFKHDVEAFNYATNINLLPALGTQVDYELGYGIMRLAMELAVLDSLKNITNHVNLNAIGHALVASRAYLTRSSTLSKDIINVISAMQSPFSDKALVMRILDTHSEEKPPEFFVFEHIVTMVNKLLEIHKGLIS